MTAPPSPPSRKPASATAAESVAGSVAAPVGAERAGSVRFRALVRASGGPRYTVALAVDAAGTGLLRPFMLL